MDDSIMESLTGFDAVWQRVTCHEGPERTAAKGKRAALEDTLLLLIHDETCAAAGAASLARLCQGDGRATLLRHAADARRHLRRLRAEYFILTGVMAGSNEDCRAVSGKLASLRDAYLQSGTLAERYSAAAGAADNPELRDAFTGFAADERRRGQELRALLIESF